MTIHYGLQQPESFRDKCFVEQLNFNYSGYISFYTYEDKKNIEPNEYTVAIFTVKPKP